VKSIAGNQKLHTLTATQVWTDHNAFARAINVQQQNLNRITEVIMIKLIVANAMEPDGCAGRYHEIERRTGWPPVDEWWWQPAGCNALFTYESHAHEPASGMWLQLQQAAKLIGS